MQLPIRSFNIGIKTREQILGEKDSASDRIRAVMVADQFESTEIYREDTNYASIIFHHVDFEGLKRHKKLSKEAFAVLDICDYVWHEHKETFRFAKEVDAVIVATQALKDKLIEDGLGTPITVIGDGHDIFNRRKKWHKNVAKNVVWFGYIGNQHVLDEFYDFLKERNLNLRIIADENIGKGDEFVKWNVDTYYDLINECDFALLPKNGEYKTDNKIVTAWLCGLPVARTKQDIVNFISKRGRLEYLKDVDYYKYNIHSRAFDYNRLCDEYHANK